MSEGLILIPLNQNWLLILIMQREFALGLNQIILTIKTLEILCKEGGYSLTLVFVS